MPPCAMCSTLGGTKCGALFGEAVVITNDALKTGFPLCHQTARRHAGQRPPAGPAVSGPAGMVRTAPAAAPTSRWPPKPTGRRCRSAPPLKPKGVRVLHDSPHQPAILRTARRLVRSAGRPLCHERHGQARRQPHGGAHLHQLGPPAPEAAAPSDRRRAGPVKLTAAAPDRSAQEQPGAACF